MSDVLLECESFNLQTRAGLFSSGGFTLSKGEIAVLHGSSHERVSELLYLISGLYNNRGATAPAKGDSLIREDIQVPSEELSFLKFKGKSLYELSNNGRERASRIGFIFENPELFIIGNTVLEEFRYSFAAVGQPPRPSQFLQRYGFNDRKILYRTEYLSGGEHHRLNCAAVLELEPEVLIADFSNSNLDHDFTDNLVRWLEELASKGTGIILTGLHANKFSIPTTSYVLENGNLASKTPDATMFPDSANERTKLSTLLKRRSVGTKQVLNVSALGVPPITTPVSFDLREREIIMLQGPNGSGKTTLGKILTKRIRKGFTGTFWHAENNPVMSLQYPERTFIMRTVAETLPDEALLRLCGIEINQHAVHPRKLPRAQQKLLTIALTLDLSKGYAILDEPTSGMDFFSKQKFISLLNRFEDKAVIIITHDEAILFPEMTKLWKDIIRG